MGNALAEGREESNEIGSEKNLLEVILGRDNLNSAYKRVVSNGGCAGVDGMSCDELKAWLMTHGAALKESLLKGKYKPNPVKRVEIPKDNGKKRQLGIPTAVDRLVQQAVANEPRKGSWELSPNFWRRNSF